MKILSPKQIKALDIATLHRQGIESIDLMHRAAETWFDHLMGVILMGSEAMRVAVICGPGNNGGDGWAIASLAAEEFSSVTVFDLQSGSKSKDCRYTEKSFQQEAAENTQIVRIKEGQALPDLTDFDLLIDAFLGIGLSRPINGYWAEVVEHFNERRLLTFAVDIPSGLLADQPSVGAAIKANFTFTFQQPKLIFFAQEAGDYIGEWEVVDIGLDENYSLEMESPYHSLEPYFILQLLRRRKRFSHKGTFGHALLIAGSYGKIGAATLSARAALRAGAGLVTVHLPKCGYQIMQIAFPEAMCSVDPHEFVFSSFTEEANRYQAIGVGPGLGTNELTVAGMQQLLAAVKDQPLILDADALNIISQQPEWLEKLPKGSILTPHPKEFERLFGPTADSFSRWELQRSKAQALGLVVVLKGAHTTIALPNGDLFFNRTGNPGMGTAGTGDALTGMITGLVAQAYLPEIAALLGVFLHGAAGDLAAKIGQEESLLASDLIEMIGPAFSELRELLSPPDDF